MSSFTGTGKGTIQRGLIWFWDLIDISDNMRRCETAARRHNNGLTAWANFVAMLVLTIVAFALAWKFDFESTLIGMSSLKDTVLEGLPSSVLKFSYFIILALTVAPTVVEMFTGAFAKADVKIMQVYVVAFTIFDLITDIPRVTMFVNQNQSSIDLLGPLSGIGYWIFFMLWLFLATIGFELGLVLTGYLAIIYFFKGLAGDEPVRGGARMPSSAGKTTIDLGEGEKVKIG